MRIQTTPHVVALGNPKNGRTLGADTERPGLRAAGEAEFLRLLASTGAVVESPAVSRAVVPEVQLRES